MSRQDLILEAQSNDTESEAHLVASIVGNQPFILVTEASHMPRALALFKKQGTHPIADPTDFRTSHVQATEPQDLFPDAEELRVSQRAVYEYLGLAWGKSRGKIWTQPTLAYGRGAANRVGPCWDRLGVFAGGCGIIRASRA